MATLVSPGVSVTVIDESFYIPASAPTVPLFFVATRSGKTQPNGAPAAATFEHSMVRTVTSIGQSAQLYGVPYFWRDSSGKEFHGDARNEYGLFALNQFLGVGNLAYVVRANIDLTDSPEEFISVNSSRQNKAPVASEVMSVTTGDGQLGSISVPSRFVKPDTFNVVFNSDVSFTVSDSSGIIGVGTVDTPFTSTKVNFTIESGSVDFVSNDYFTFDLVYEPTTFLPLTGANGTMTKISVDEGAVEETWSVRFTSPTMFEVSGSVSGDFGAGAVGTMYGNGYISFLIDSGSVAFEVGDEFTLVLESIMLNNPLGANDSAKRVAIAAALQAEINTNAEVRSEIYEYNLIVCPGYPEVADELDALSTAIGEEAFVIADVPLNKSPAQAAAWAQTAERVQSKNVAYYYPWGVSSNLDGRNVLVAPSGIALRTYANSDNQSYVWFAPAGVNRGTVSGVTSVGYVSGELGTATTFVETNLNQGDRDNLYNFFKNINPIVFFPGRGLIVWGQKTSAGAASALDRVNVMREIMYIRRQLRKNSFPFVFEPNDKLTRDNLKAAADGFLNDILSKRGLYDFVTLCDESNNTPDRIDRNEMYLDVALKPVKAAEFIYIPIRVLDRKSVV